MDILHGLLGQSVVLRAVKELNFANVFVPKYQVKMEEHRAKEKMKRPKNVAWCRAVHQVFCVFDPKWRTGLDLKFFHIYFGQDNWLRITIKIRLLLQLYSSRREVSGKFRQRKLVSCQASTLYPPIRHECKPGWNQNKQLSTQAFETDMQMMQILPLSRWPLKNDGFIDLCSVDARYSIVFLTFIEIFF